MPVLPEDSLGPAERLLSLVGRLHHIDGKPQKEIANDQDVRQLYFQTRGKTADGEATLSPATVNRLLARAGETGVVSVTVDASFGVEASRDDKASLALRDTFGLQECCVVKVTGSDCPADPTPAQLQAEEDRLTLGLINVETDELRKSLGSGEHVLCAGGRTICWLARGVRRRPVPKRDLIFTPLGGRLWVEDFRTGDADIMERPLDADDAAHMFAEAFEDQPGGRFSQINQPLYCRDSKEAEDILRNHCAIGVGKWNWGLPPGDRAYLGVGSMDSGSHRLALFLRKYEAGDKAALKSFLSVAGEQLVEIKRLCQELGSPMPGDVGNRLFACLPVASDLKERSESDDPGLERLTAGFGRVAKIVEELNQRAVVIPWSRLRGTRHVRAIAAGKGKLSALWTIVLATYFDAKVGRQQGRPAVPLVTEVATDYASAAELRAELAILENNPHLLRWCSDRLAESGLLAPSEDDKPQTDATIESGRS